MKRVIEEFDREAVVELDVIYLDIDDDDDKVMITTNEGIFTFHHDQD